MPVRFPLRWTLPAAALALGLLFARWRTGMFDWTFVDLAVYRDAGSIVLHGGSVYSTATGALPFTYPPFAAVLFAPLAALDLSLAAVLMSTLSALALVVVVTVSGRAVGVPPGWLGPASVAALALEPVWLSLQYGQINLLLTAMILLDCFVVPPRYRGVLTGVAAGIKLTPGIFLGWFLLRRDWRAAVLTGAGGLATLLAGALVDPGGSWRFWTKLWHDPGRVGGLAYADNQSLYGILARLQRSLHPAELLVLSIDVVTLLLAGYAARRQLKVGQRLAGLTVIGFAGLLVSPVSWSHHWTWVVPALFVLWQQRRWAGLLVVAVASYSAVQFLPPNSFGVELQATWWQQVCYANLPIAGGLFLLLMLTVPPRHAAGDPAATGQAAVQTQA